MGLKEYHRKRDFKKTAEPAGEVASSKSGFSYVIQKHDATRLHYDFRLELNGVLLSWAVPKGPSFDPKDKRLAVHVEDHPLQYGTFEGTIPKGEYSGGTVMVWDRGTWEPLGDAEAMYRKGSMKFRLHGEKLRGAWALVRMHGRDDDQDNWLLLKERDDEARPASEYDVTAELDRSVATERSIDEIAEAADLVWKGGEAVATKPAKAAKKPKVAAPPPAPKAAKPAGGAPRKAAMPESLSPQLATLVSEAPVGPEWLHELKFDGYRVLAFLEKGKARLITRNGNDWTRKFTTLAAAAEKLPVENVILDGEVIVVNKQGRADFQALQNALEEHKKADFRYVVFDLVYLNGYDLTKVALEERRKALRELVGKRAKSDLLQFSEAIDGEGEEVYKNACALGTEGIISKRRDSRYTSARTRDWVKVKCLNRQEFVVGGFSAPEGSRTGFGALLIGYYDEAGKLRYAGRVGTGFDTAMLDTMTAKLEKLETDKAPFDPAPKGVLARDVRWVRPELVVEIEFSNWTNGGNLRHPSFQGLREDKGAREVRRETAQPVEAVAPQEKTIVSKAPKSSSAKSSKSVEVAGVPLSNPDRVLFPEQGITKRELAEYYVSIADWILPLVARRPLAMVRCPGGREKQCFFQKHFADGVPEQLSAIEIQEKTEIDTYSYITGIEGIVALVQVGVLEIHPWGCTVDNVEKPDQMIFDFDPGEGVEWPAVVAGALLMRKVLEGLGLQSFPKISGGKGIHVVVPIARRIGWDEMKQFSKDIVDTIVRGAPEHFTGTLSKANRRGKIFVDYLRNGRGSTAVAAYSTRAREGAPVAVPLAWDEVTVDLRPNQYNVRNLGKRLAALKRDPWEEFHTVKQGITAAMIKRVAKGS